MWEGFNIIFFLPRISRERKKEIQKEEILCWLGNVWKFGGIWLGTGTKKSCRQKKRMAKYIHVKMVSDQEKMFNQQSSYQQISNQQEQYQEQIFHQFKEYTFIWKQTTIVLRSLFATWRHVLSNGQIPNKIMENVHR